MLNLSGKDKIKIAGLVDYKNLYIEKELASGDKTLAFLYPKTSKFYSDIEEECYITTKEDEFIVKEKNVQNDYTEFKCILNLEDLEGKPWERYASEEQPIDKALALALAGTGWIVGNCSLKKKRTVRATNVSSLDVIQEIRKTYRCDLVFNTLTKTIDVHERLGEDKGTYFIDSLNLKNLAIQGNSYNFFTRIIPIGKDDLRISSINNGKDYLENYQYSNKVKTYYWIDERYTIVENLKEDAAAKLDEISKPYRAYVADIINLAKLNDKYKDILDFKLGDTVHLISKDNKFRDKQRIVKIIEHPDEHELDSVEIANTTLSFEEKQTQFEEASDTVNNITTDNGTIDGSTVDGIHTDQIYDFKAQVVQAVDLSVINAKITNLEAHNVNITGKLNSVEAHIGILETNVATIDKLTVTHSASINDLQANKASITQLEVVNASIKVLEANVGKIETLVNGNLSSENIQAGGITSDKLTIANGFIKNAMIASLDVNKINAGDISTNKFRIKSDDGGIEIVGATQQFKDKNNKVRIQMGKDSKGNFNFIIIGEDGTTTLIDHTGVKAKAIADDLIVNNMIASDAVGEKQINYSSFTNGFNKDTNTNTLKATKIKLDNQNQSLEVAFNSLKTQSDGTKTLTESHSTTITVMQGQINTAINNTQIFKDGQTILLKDDYNRTVQTVNSMNSTIGSHTTQINQAKGDITKVETRVNTVERDLSSITFKVSANETNIRSVNDLANNANNKALSAEQLAKAMSDSKMIHLDPNFRQGYNNVSLYNNANNGNVVVTRIPKVSDCPTTSTHCLEIKHIGSGSPGFGGFYQNITSRANAIFIQKFIAKLPTGYTLNTASNSMGTGYTDKWLSPNQGTGKWETYIREVRCGATGTFSSGGHVYVSGSTTPSTSSPLVWYLAYCTCFDLTDNDETMNSLKTEISATTSRVSSIEASLTSITSRVSSVESTTTSINGQVSSLSTRMNSAEQKITDSSIISIVSKQFYSKGECDNKYTTQSQLTQLNNSFEFKLTQIGSPNIVSNSNFDADGHKWYTHNGATIDFNASNYLEKYYGKMVGVSCNQSGGIFQRVNTIPGEKYTVSFYALALNLKPLRTNIGVEGFRVITLEYEPGFKRWSYEFVATSSEHTFIAYTVDPGTFFIGRIMINQGSLREYSRRQDEIYSKTVRLDGAGVTIESPNCRTKTNIDTNGMEVIDTKDNTSILSAKDGDVVAKGGHFKVTHPQNGEIVLWGRDVVINNGRALVGTGNISELGANKLFINYNNDFINGVNIGGNVSIEKNLQVNNHDVITNMGLVKQPFGYQIFSNGLILQWGTYSGFGDGDTTVYYAIEFPNACVHFNPQFEGDRDTMFDVHASYVSRTSATVVTKFMYGFNDRSRLIKWFAIGY
ncbi:phage tail spike protein [Paraclostridium bifermentans]|uniref:phage tail spike protein n=1 Tax=Paraclostridium bifermentans TaxID=1490 RepID=UPI0018AAD261|nr:phage tail spike protein [Paraclostridium bifermentans]